MKYIKRFVLMLQFLTAVPIPAKLECDQEDFGKGLVFAPVVGFMLGAFLAGTFYVSGLVLPVLAAAAIVQVLYIILTGGLHLDGLGDTYDGMFPRRSKERMLEIMRDSRVGTNAVLAVGSVLLLNAAFISSLDAKIILQILVMMPAAGRVGSLVSCSVSRYAREGQGLGKNFMEYCGGKELLMGMLLYIPLTYLVMGLSGLILCLIPVLSALFFTWFFNRRIGGGTGDTAGAVCELNQTFFLLAALILARLTVI